MPQLQTCHVVLWSLNPLERKDCQAVKKKNKATAWWLYSLSHPWPDFHGYSTLQNQIHKQSRSLFLNHVPVTFDPSWRTNPWPDSTDRPLKLFVSEGHVLNLQSAMLVRTQWSKKKSGKRSRINGCFAKYREKTLQAGLLLQAGLTLLGLSSTALFSSSGCKSLKARKFKPGFRSLTSDLHVDGAFIHC